MKMLFRNLGLLVAVIVAMVAMASCGSDNAEVGTSEPDDITENTNDEDSAADGELIRADVDPQDVVRMYIGPELVDCVGVAPQLCMQVSESGHSDYEFFYGRIQGFEPVVGVRYVIDVVVTEIENPPADASSLEYRLLEIIEEES